MTGTIADYERAIGLLGWELVREPSSNAALVRNANVTNMEQWQKMNVFAEAEILKGLDSMGLPSRQQARDAITTVAFAGGVNI